MQIEKGDTYISSSISGGACNDINSLTKMGATFCPYLYTIGIDCINSIVYILYQHIFKYKEQYDHDSIMILII